MATTQQYDSAWSGTVIDTSVGAIHNGTYENQSIRTDVNNLKTQVNAINAQSIGAVEQYSTLPNASSANKNRIVQYTGANISGSTPRTQGYFYISTGSKWIEAPTQNIPTVTIDPSLNASSSNAVRNSAIKSAIDTVQNNVNNLALNTSSMRGKKNGYASLDDNVKVTAAEASSAIVSSYAGGTLGLTHAGKFIVGSNSSNGNTTVTIKVPANDNVAFPTGTEIEILRYQAGEVRLTPAVNGVYLRSTIRTVTNAGSYIYISQRYGTVGLKKVGANNWIVTGAIK